MQNRKLLCSAVQKKALIYLFRFNFNVNSKPILMSIFFVFFLFRHGIFLEQFEQQQQPSVDESSSVESILVVSCCNCLRRDDPDNFILYDKFFNRVQFVVKLLWNFYRIICPRIVELTRIKVENQNDLYYRMKKTEKTFCYSIYMIITDKKTKDDR